MTDIEDKRTPIIGVTLASSVDLAEASYEAGWRGAIVAAHRLIIAHGKSPEPDLTMLMRALSDMMIEPSPSITKMREALK